MIRIAAVLFLFSLQLTFAQPSPVSIHVDASKEIGDMVPFWSFFGYDEPNYTTRKDGHQLLEKLKQLSPTTVYIRTHNLLTSIKNTINVNQSFKLNYP